MPDSHNENGGTVNTAEVRTESAATAAPHVAVRTVAPVPGLVPSDPAPTANIRLVMPKMRTSNGVLMTDVNKVVNSIGAAPSLFPSPEPGLEAVARANKEFQDSLVAKEFVSTATRKATKAKKTALLSLFLQLSAYVLGVAKGDVNIVDASGFVRASTRKKSVANPTPDTPVLASPKPGAANGTALLKIKSFGNAKIFLVERKDAEGNWVIIDAFNTLAFTVTGLPKGPNTLRVWAKRGDKRSPQPSSEVTVSVL